MAFNWRREPSNPYLPADGSLAQMYSNDMNGYRPLQLPVQKTPNELAADAAQSMAGYTRNNMDNYRPNIMGDQVPGGQQPAPDFEGYGESLQAASDAAVQAQAKEQQIANIQSQIKTLQARIAENQAKLKNWNGGDVANKVAALEARKFFSQDPTSIWRWKTERDEARRLANEQKNSSDNVVRANALFEIQNDLDSIIVDDKMTSQDQKAYLSKLSNLKTLAQKNNLPTDAIDKKIKEVKGETETSNTNGPEGTEYEGTSREQWDNEAEELLKKPNLTQGDIMKFKQKNPNISNGVRQKLEEKHSALIESDKKKTYEKKWNSYLADYEKEHGKVSDAFAKTLRRIYDKKNKKG